MVDFIALLEAAENADGVLDGWLGHHDLLKPAFQCLVLLNVLLVLLEGGRADAPQFASGKKRFQEIRRVHGTRRGPCTDNSMDLVDEEHDVTIALLDLAQDGLEAFLELAPVLCPGDKSTHVQGYKAALLEGIRDVAGDDSLSQALGNRGLSYSRLPQEDWVVLRPAAQDLHRPPDLVIPSNHWVQFAVHCGPGQVLAILFEGLKGCIRRLTRDL
mmetsp:Transcript_10904/g.31281  ORF Transcript_10904/g.31281 Transcript_10904/m.31281 type:complete len:215 (-) Transcript_10904:328-972(-)